jgi:hypothetical protein
MQDISVVPGALGRVGYRDNTGGAALPSWDGRHTYTVLTRESSRSSSATLDGSPVAYALRDGEGEAESDGGYDDASSTNAPPASVGTTGAGATR